ncbi:MAG: CAP domain-containing protein [Proteobacteria bacterium]|nr:MAG: CAP domain-containing protein [Pseudomonadota bacterium]
MLKSFLLALSLFSFIACAEGAEKPCFAMNPEACEVFYLTNAERMGAGKPELRYCARCFAMAQEQSEDMFRRAYFSHARPPVAGASNGESFAARTGRFGLGWVGENIAQTDGGQERAVAMWMSSPGHRRNILNSDYTSFAVGYEEGLYTQVFVNDAGAQ